MKSCRRQAANSSARQLMVVIIIHQFLCLFGCTVNRYTSVVFLNSQVKSVFIYIAQYHKSQFASRGFKICTAYDNERISSCSRSVPAIAINTSNHGCNQINQDQILRIISGYNLYFIITMYQMAV